MKIDSKVYDVLAWMNRVFIPATGTLVATILALCKVDPATIAFISGIFTAVDFFLGTLLQGSKAKFDAEKTEAIADGNQ